MMQTDPKLMTKEDICAHYGDDYDRFLGAVTTPIYQTSLLKHVEGTGFGGKGGYSYSRMRNPTIEVAEKKVAALELAEEGICFASGVAAISAACLHFVAEGDHVITLRNAYFPTRHLLGTYLKRFNISYTEVVGDKIEEFEAAIQPNTKLIMLESPTTYTFQLQDIRAIAELAKAKGIGTVLDNTWASPMYQNPIAMGIDIVVHAVSKYIGGHSDLVAGVLVSTQEICDQIRGDYLGLFGACMNPQAAFLMIRGIRTLPVRMKAFMESGLAMANFLEQHPKVVAVNYPGLKSHPQYELGKKQMTGYGALLSFTPRLPDQDTMTAFLNEMTAFQNACSWGGFESLLGGCASFDKEEAEKVGLLPGTMRMMVGLENIHTLMDEIDFLLNKYCK